MPIYMQILNIPGEVTAKGYEKYHELFDLSFELAKVTGGKVGFSPFNVTTLASSGSPRFMLACAKETVFEKVTIAEVKMGQSKILPTDVFVLEGVRISDQKTQGDGGSPFAVGLSLTFGRITWTHTTYDSKEIGTSVTNYWDLVAGKGG